MLLISSPAKAWEEIRLEEDRRKVFTAFVYPMIGLCGLSVFIGSLLAKGWGGPESFQYAMTQCCAVAVSLFGGYFLAAYLINGMRVKMFMMDSDMPLTQQFAGYALVVLFLLVDESRRERPVTVYNHFFHPTDCLSYAHSVYIQQANDGA